MGVLKTCTSDGTELRLAQLKAIRNDPNILNTMKKLDAGATFTS